MVHLKKIMTLLSPVTRNEKIVLAIIFIGALSIRTLFVLQNPWMPVKDAAEYDSLAMRFVAGRGYVDANGLPTASAPPLYPFLLTVIYFIFGHSYTAVRIIQSFMGAATCIVIYLIAKKIYNKKVGLLSALIAAGYLPFISFYYGPASILTETLFVFLFSTSILYLLKIDKWPSTANSILAGITLGLATLTRPVVLLFPLIIFVWLLSVRSKRKEFLRAFFLVTISFIIVLYPWIIRNYAVFHKIVPVSTKGGGCFYVANNSESRGLGSGAIPNSYDLHLRLAGASEAERSRALFKKGLDFLVQNPGKVPKLFLRKMILFWDISYRSERSGKLIYNLAYGIILPFSLLGLFISLRGEYKRKGLLLLLIILYYYISHDLS